MSADACTFVNAGIDGEISSLRIAAGRINARGESPRPRDRVIDLRGDRLLPGLINAHDHLQLNHYPRLRFRAGHENVSEWIQDIDSRRATDPVLVGCARVPRATRLLHGALKNLLSGVTTVAHHDPFYAETRAAGFPIRVAAPYGWSHSLYIEGAAAVQAACEAASADQPWMIHAGEGVDSRAAAEFSTLEALGCLRANTVLIHGVGFSADELACMVSRGASLVWCPASNDYLFGATADVRPLVGTGRLALGSDSRLSGSRDLLAELAVACSRLDMSEAQCERLLTQDAAGILRLPDRGTLRPGALADLCILPARALSTISRADVRAVLIGGEFRFGDADYRDVFDDASAMAPLILDGRCKWLDQSLAAALIAQGIREPGLEWPDRRVAAAG